MYHIGVNIHFKTENFICLNIKEPSYETELDYFLYLGR